MSVDPMLAGIDRWDDGDYEVELEPVADGIYVLFSDLPALLAAAREDERAHLYTMGQLADRIEESYEEGRAEGYARGLIEGDHGGRREGYRIGYAAGKDAVMTASYAQAVAEGQRDALAALDNAEVWGRIMKVLNDNGINTQDGSIHSWRCFDKERYPEPCSCAAEVVVEIIQAIKGDSDD